MNNFESAGVPTTPTKTIEQKGSGLEGMCEKCQGGGRVGFLKTRVCPKCHGKGFVNSETSETKEAYSWDTGLRH